MNTLQPTRHRGRFLPSLVLLFPLALAGCGKSVGEVSGTVTYNGKPLPSGTVTFYPESGQPVWAECKEDGTYCVQNAPTGPVKITVHSRPRIPPALATPEGPDPDLSKLLGPGGVPQKPVKPAVGIDERYQDAEKSGLTYTVMKGKQVHNIRLMP